MRVNSFNARAIVALGLASVATPALSAAAAPAIGPRPSDARIQELGRAAITSDLLDPNAAKLVWYGGALGDGWKPVMERRVPGWWTCGRINGKNQFGGYAGFRPFVVVVANDQVVYKHIGTGQYPDVVQARCDAATRSGQLQAPPPAGE